MPAGITLRGERLATGTAVPIVLWKVDGPVRLARGLSQGAAGDRARRASATRGASLGISTIARMSAEPPDVPRRRRRAAARRARAGERDSVEPRRGLAPLLVLAGIVLAAFALYTWLASLVDVRASTRTRVRYLIAASSLVEGEGLTLRGDEYGFGPLYALVLAAILWLSSGVDPAYDLFKANALFFALTAVPVYLLARRLVSPWWAVCAAGLAVAIPSSISVATVMTESLAYPRRPGRSTRRRSPSSGRRCSDSSPCWAPSPPPS